MIDTTIFLFGLAAFYLLLIWLIRIESPNSKRDSSQGFFGIRDADEFYDKYKDKKPF